MHRQIKHCDRVFEGLSAKEAIPKGFHSRETSAQKVRCLYMRKEKKTKLNSNLIKFLTDNNTNSITFLSLLTCITKEDN